MNIGIDIDGTITEAPEFFATFAKGFRAAGHKVYVVSYRDQIDIEDSTVEMREFGVEFDGIHHSVGRESIPDFKARIARELDLDIFFDDMPEALLKLPPKCIRFWMCNPSVYDMNKVVDNLIGILKFG